MSDSIRLNGPLPPAGSVVTVFQNGQPLTGIYTGQGSGLNVGGKTYF